MADFPIPEGYYLLGGVSKENARKALAEAEEGGFTADSVLTRNDGFLIPLPPEAKVQKKAATSKSTASASEKK